jgi:tRNA(fMet)-specific endonuclease VapC
VIYLLDTNACIRYLNGRGIALLERMQRTVASEIAVCSVVRLELFYGALHSQNPARTLAKQTKFLDRFVFLPLDDRAAHRGAEIRAALARIGQPIGAYDVLIAAIALANDLTLITHNVAEFSRIAGLRYEDWEAGDAPAPPPSPTPT